MMAVKAQAACLYADPAKVTGAVSLGLAEAEKLLPGVKLEDGMALLGPTRCIKGVMVDTGTVRLPLPE